MIAQNKKTCQACGVVKYDVSTLKKHFLNCYKKKLCEESTRIKKQQKEDIELQTEEHISAITQTESKISAD
jgi:cell fate (sporulation/competence/biofilm development) regulator YmcA (YheA/YmcA/DUF963 family)